jgi:hypothetical protein
MIIEIITGMGVCDWRILPSSINDCFTKNYFGFIRMFIENVYIAVNFF